MSRTPATARWNAVLAPIAPPPMITTSARAGRSLMTGNATPAAPLRPRGHPASPRRAPGASSRPVHLPSLGALRIGTPGPVALQHGGVSAAAGNPGVRVDPGCSSGVVYAAAEDIDEGADVRAVVFAGAGGNEVIRLEERPDPVPGSEELLLQVTHAGLNPGRSGAASRLAILRLPAARRTSPGSRSPARSRPAEHRCSAGSRATASSVSSAGAASPIASSSISARRRGAGRARRARRGRRSRGVHHGARRDPQPGGTEPGRDPARARRGGRRRQRRRPDRDGGGARVLGTAQRRRRCARARARR